MKDQASLNEALPKLQRAGSELDQLNGLANRLPPEARDKLAETIKTATARLKSGLDNVNAMPGLAPDAKPLVAALRSKLDALAMTPDRWPSKDLQPISRQRREVASVTLSSTAISTTTLARKSV